MLSSISPWVAGIIGGLTANFAANWLWRKYNKPRLEFEREAETDFEVDEDGSPYARRFKVSVKNIGKTAAKNCKPKIRLKGKYADSEYDIENTVCWAEAGKPARITINPGETAEFQFFRIRAEEIDAGVVKTETVFYVEFPASAGESETSDIVEWLYSDNTSKIQGANFHDRIKKDVFEDMVWDDNEVIVTSENTDRIDGFVTLVSEIEDTQGLVGINANIISK